MRIKCAVLKVGPFFSAGIFLPFGLLAKGVIEIHENQSQGRLGKTTHHKPLQGGRWDDRCKDSYKDPRKPTTKWIRSS